MVKVTLTVRANVKNGVHRLAGALNGQVASCILGGPPLNAIMTAYIPSERVARVQQVASLVGATCVTSE